MGREVNRVPLDFAWPIGKVWKGYLSPASLDGIECRDCGGRGYSPQYQSLHDRWYGKVPFHPEEHDSAPFTASHPAIWARAERNVANAPDSYGTGAQALMQEAQRLADHFNNAWPHHLTQDDVDALLAAGRLRDLTHTWTRENGWQPIEPAVVVTARMVNEWSLGDFSHASSNAYYVIKARCDAAEWPTECTACDGHGTTEVYPGQREDADAWERTEPPKGDGWQLWETVSEGSPISPVFASAEELAAWMASPAYTWGASKNSQLSYEGALAFVKAGWSPSGMTLPGKGFVDGVEAVAALESEKI